MDDDAADDNDGGYGHGVGDGDGLGLGPGDDNDDESSPLSLYYLVSVLSEREQILLQVENISLSPLLLVFAFPTLLHIQHPFSRHSLYKKKGFFHHHHQHSCPAQPDRFLRNFYFFASFFMIINGRKRFERKKEKDSQVEVRCRLEVENRSLTQMSDVLLCFSL